MSLLPPPDVWSEPFRSIVVTPAAVTVVGMSTSTQQPVSVPRHGLVVTGPCRYFDQGAESRAESRRRDAAPPRKPA